MEVMDQFNRLDEELFGEVEGRGDGLGLEDGMIGEEYPYDEDVVGLGDGYGGFPGEDPLRGVQPVSPARSPLSLSHHQSSRSPSILTSSKFLASGPAPARQRRAAAAPSYAQPTAARATHVAMSNRKRSANKIVRGPSFSPSGGVMGRSPPPPRKPLLVTSMGRDPAFKKHHDDEKRLEEQMTRLQYEMRHLREKKKDEYEKVQSRFRRVYERHQAEVNQLAAVNAHQQQTIETIKQRYAAVVRRAKRETVALRKQAQAQKALLEQETNEKNLIADERGAWVQQNQFLRKELAKMQKQLEEKSEESKNMAKMKRRLSVARNQQMTESDTAHQQMVRTLNSRLEGFFLKARKSWDRRMVKRVKVRVMACWVALYERQRARKKKMRKVIQRLLFRNIYIAFQTWQHGTEEFVRLQGTMKRVVAHMRDRRLAVSFDGWKDKIDKRVRARQLLEKIIGKVENKQLAAGFETWRGFTEDDKASASCWGRLCCCFRRKKKKKKKKRGCLARLCCCCCKPKPTPDAEEPPKRPAKKGRRGAGKASPARPPKRAPERPTKDGDDAPKRKRCCFPFCCFTRKAKPTPKPAETKKKKKRCCFPFCCFTRKGTEVTTIQVSPAKTPPSRPKKRRTMEDLRPDETWRIEAFVDEEDDGEPPAWGAVQSTAGARRRGRRQPVKRRGRETAASRRGSRSSGPEQRGRRTSKSNSRRRPSRNQVRML